MNSFYVFLWGLSGSMAVELLQLSKCYYRKNFDLPYRYKMWHFYVMRILLAAIGGGLAVAYGIDNPLLAANIGAATPLIIDAMSKGIIDDSKTIRDTSVMNITQRNASTNRGEAPRPES